MESCIAAMEGILARLARGELTNPLRFLVSPDGPTAMGLMPSHAAGDNPVYALKEIVVAPGNSASGLDPHQGAVLLHDGATGQLIAILNASPITEIRTAAVSGVATRLLARPGSRTVAILGSGVQGRSHVDAMQTVLDDPIIRIWSRNGDHAEALALETHSLVAGSIEEALAGADVVCTATSSREPIVELEWLAPGHPHQCRRGLPGREVARAQHRHGRRVASLRRPARVDAERGGRLPVRGRRERHRPGAHRRGARRAAQRHRRGPALGRRADGVQVDGDRRRGSRGGAALRRAGARARRRRRGRVLIPLAEIEAARERIADVVMRTPLVRLQVPESPAEIWLKLECLQPIGSFKIRGAANAIRSAPPGAVDRGVLTTSAGNMAQGVAWMARELGVPATIVAPEHAPQTKLDAIERLGGTRDQGAVRALVADDGGGLVSRRRRATSSTRCWTTQVMAGNGTIGLELVEDLDGDRHRARPLGRRRPVDRDRERARAR